MKKSYLIVTVLLLNLAFVACTPQQLSDDSPISEDCCGDDIPIYPPPPPPPPPPTNGG